MAVFDVCAAVSVTGGSSFQWNNSKQYGVKITPATNWTLPASEYDIAPGATTQDINVPPVSVGQTFQINVKWQMATSPGTPCPATGANPKIVVSPARPAFLMTAARKKAKPKKKKAKPAAKKAKPARKKPAGKKAKPSKKKKH
jgi:hypothetical protein